MSITSIDIAEPFFTIKEIKSERSYQVSERRIVLNLSDTPISIQDQSLAALQSVIVQNVEIRNIEHVVLIEGFEAYKDEEALMAEIRTTWPSAFEVRGEERLRGIGHYMSPKIWIGQFGFTVYHSSTVPLKVGLHKFHDFCPVPGFREVHTLIMGLGKMQQCRENDIATLYLEEPMAPGQTHRPMYDAEGNYPWHQFETTKPSVFLAVEMLPDGASPPN